jgi:hypothetical protein
MQVEKKEYVIVNDHIQSLIDTSDKPFIKEFILLLSLYLFYTYVPQYVFVSFIKYVLILILFRYFLSVVTDIQSKSGNRHFVLNANVIIFSMVLFSLNRYQLQKPFVMWIMILSYCVLVISTKEYYTSDIILTLVLVYSIYENNYIRKYIDIMDEQLV